VIGEPIGCGDHFRLQNAMRKLHREMLLCLLGIRAHDGSCLSLLIPDEGVARGEDGLPLPDHPYSLVGIDAATDNDAEFVRPFLGIAWDDPKPGPPGGGSGFEQSCCSFVG